MSLYSVSRKARIIQTITLERKSAPLLLMLPLIITLLAITVFPIIYAVRTSLMHYELDSAVRGFNGFKNYIKIFFDLRFWNGFKNTMVFTFGAISCEIVIGMGISLLLNKNPSGSSALKTLFLIPMISTPVVISLMWVLILNPQFGLINFFLKGLGLPPQAWLANTGQAMMALIMIDVWEWTPFAILVFIAGLQSISQEIYEASAIDGANPWQNFRYITLPSLRPFILIVTVFRFMDAFRWFDTIAVVTKGGPGISTENWSFYGYISAFQRLDMGYSAALGVIMLIIVISVSQFFIKRVFAVQKQ